MLQPFNRRQDRKQGSRRNRRRLFEALESRSMMATFAANHIHAPTPNNWGVVADDLNQDGKADLAIGTGYTSAAYVAMGTGTGGLGSFSGVNTNQSPPDLFGIAAGNLSGSSAPELVVSGYSSGAFRILSNNGSGAFSTGNQYSTNGTAIQPVIADLNGDGKNDIIVARNSGGISVSYGDGNGGVLSQQTFSGASNFGLTVADLNADGRLDFAAAGTGAVTVALNQGQTPYPSFAIAQYNVNGTLFGITATDLDNDGDADLAATNISSGTVAVFGNNGSGTFASMGSVLGVSSPHGIEKADFDADGDQDLAVASYSNNTLYILRNNGGFSFTTETNSAPYNPVSLDVADFNNDGRPDIAVGNQSAIVSIYLNTSLPPNVAPTDLALTNTQIDEELGALAVVGTFSTTDQVGNTHIYNLVNGVGSTDNSSFSISGNTLRAVNNLDFETKSSYSIRVRTTDQGGLFREEVFTIDVLNVREMSFGTSTFSTPTWRITGIVATDLNQDGNADLAFASWDASAAFTAFGNGTGSLGSFSGVSTGMGSSWFMGIAAGNLSGNSAPELVVSGYYSGGFSTLANNGAGGVSGVTSFGVGANANQVVIADINADGFNDMIVGRLGGSGGVAIAYGNGAGGILTTHYWSGGMSLTGVVVADFNGDGRLDIAGAAEANYQFTVLINQGQSLFPNFTHANFNSNGDGPIGITATDLDNDGDADLAISHRNNRVVTVHRNNGSGSFTFMTSILPSGGYSYGIDSADFDGDGKQDLVVASYSHNTVDILRNKGGFVFSTQSVGVPSSPLSLDVADFNNDGRPDVAVGQYNSNAVSLLLNTSNFDPTDIALNNATVPENAAPGAFVGTFSTVDHAGSTLSYSLVSGAGDSDNAAFILSPSGVLQTNSSFDYEAKGSYSIRVRTTDQGGLFREESFVVSIEDIKELLDFDVQKDQTQRSFLRYIDLAFESAAGVADLITGGRIKLDRYALTGAGPATPIGLSGLSSSGDQLKIDFGVQGIGGNRNTNVGNGYYRLGLDLDDNGSFETELAFYRLLGDVDGDRSVTSTDVNLIPAAYGTTNAERDVNGDGIVNATDRTLAQRALNSSLNYLLDLDD